MDLTPTDLPLHAQRLLEALRTPESCADFDAPTWDRLIRAARSARLLGTLAARVAAALPPQALDVTVRRHLLAGTVEADFRMQKVRYLLSVLEPFIVKAAVPCVLLKGSAYIAQRLAFAEGRMPADVDVMVPRSALHALEKSLLAEGFQYEANLTPYDHQYYRDWSHELPPLRSAGQSLELDLHHTILPPLGRLKPDTQALFDAAQPVAGTPFSVLCPADQALLAAAHLFHDSDCTNRLRDLVDIDALLRTFAAADAGFWQALDTRARLHHLGRPLWYAVAFARAWLGTPVPDHALARIDALRPPAAASALLAAFATRTLPPIDPDGEWTRARGRATQVLVARATWLRMPPHLVAQHALHKLVGSLQPRAAATKPETA
jgi:hypothetical protein